MPAIAECAADEICGLELADIGQDDAGIWFFDVRKNDTCGLKNGSSARKIPIGTELVRLGFLEDIAALRAEGEKLVFPELAAESGIGTMGDAFYKMAWSKIASKLPFLARGQAMHAFRHTAIDAMSAAGIPDKICADFAGHAIAGETTERYAKRSRLAQLLAAVETIPKVTADIEPTPLLLLPKSLRNPRKARVKRPVSTS